MKLITCTLTTRISSVSMEKIPDSASLPPQINSLNTVNGSAFEHLGYKLKTKISLLLKAENKNLTSPKHLYESRFFYTVNFL